VNFTTESDDKFELFLLFIQKITDAILDGLVMTKKLFWSGWGIVRL
jgi:hypothetical protein